MTAPKPSNIRYERGKLVFNGAPMGNVANVDFRPNMEFGTIEGEEFGGATVAASVLKTFAVMGCILRGWDGDAIAQLPGGSASLLSDPVALSGILRTGGLLVVEPEDPAGVKLELASAIAFIGDDTGFAFSVANEFGIPALFVGETVGESGSYAMSKLGGV